MGAGAAGLMTAIAAAREAERLKKTPSIALFDSKKKIGAKILISGGTRCNVTNVSVTPADYEGASKHFVKHVFEAFTPEKTRRFFEEIGVDLVLEPTGKYFPTTHSGRTVLEALMKELELRGVKLMAGVKISEIKKSDLSEGPSFLLKSEESEFQARKVILCTGGLSYPETGSDGTGYRMAQAFGHTLVPTHAALTPLLTNDADWPGLSGVTMDVTLSYYKKGKKEKSATASFLFTHFGFSGPVALDISRYWSAHEKGEGAIQASFLPQEDETSFRKLLESEMKSAPKRFLKNFLTDFGLTQRFADVFLKKLNLETIKPLRQLTKGDKAALVEGLFRYPLEINGVYGYKKAEATAGGIDLREVSIGTMESKKVPGLYFAGEILDIDGRIGGFNFQWAWSTGTIAGSSAAKASI